MSTLISSPPATVQGSNLRQLGPWYLTEWLNSYACTLYLICVFYYIRVDATRGGLGEPIAASLWISAGWGFAYVPMALLAGRLTDWVGPRKVSLVMAMGSVPATLAAWPLLGVDSLSHGAILWLLFAAMTAYNFTSTCIWPALEAGISRVDAPMPLSSRMGVYNITWSSAGFMAMFTADFVMHLGWPFIFIIPSIASLLAAVSLGLLSRPLPRASGHVEAEPDPDAPPPAITPGYAKTLLKMAGIGNTMAYVAIFVLTPLIPKLSPDHASFGSLWKLTTALGFLLFSCWTAWHYKTSWLLLAYAMLVGAFAGILLFPVLPVFIVGQIFFGLAAAFIYASSLYYAMHVSSGGGAHAGTHEALIGVGIALGSAVGAVAATGGNSLLPVAIAVTGVLGVGFLTLIGLAFRVSESRP